MTSLLLNVKKQFGLRERGKREDSDLLDVTTRLNPVGGNSNPGASIGDMYDMRYINNDEIPPQHTVLIDKLDFIRVLRKGKKMSVKPKRKATKCRCRK